MAEEQEKIVVKDKRLFDESGKLREDEGREQRIDKTEPRREAGETDAEKKEDAAGERKGADAQMLPEINFLTFVLSLHTSVMFNFGDFPDPVSGKKDRNLPAAKQTIDLLGMLQKKTEGNLDKDEKELLEGILYDVRMRYIKEKGKP